MRPRTANTLYHDNLDDRREIHQLLGRLSPAKRLRWLAWCCRQSKHGATHPEVQPGHQGGQLETYFDFWALVVQYELDADRALGRLVEMVRGKCR